MNYFSDNYLRIRRSGSNKSEYSANCPFCPDKVGKEDKDHTLGFNTQKRVYHCFRCGTSGKLGSGKGASLFQESEDDFAPDSSIDTLRDRLGKVGTVEEKNVVALDLDEFSWPLTKRSTPIAYDYMITQRGFTQELIDRFQLRVGKEFETIGFKGEPYLSTKWCGRVIFPYFEDGLPIFATGRAYVDKEPKYLNSTGPKSRVLYGIERVKNRECILCEGIISAIAAEKATGIPAVAMLGKTATSPQLDRLRNVVDKVWLSLDGEVSNYEWRRSVRALVSRGFATYEVRIPNGTDPDDLKDEYKAYFDKAEKALLI